MHTIPAEDPDAAGPGGKDVALQVDLHAVGRPGRVLVVHVVEDAPVARAPLVEVVDHPDLVVLVGVGDVQQVLLGRERDAVGPGLVPDEQLQLAVRVQPVDAVEVELAQRRLLQPVEAVRRVGEVERSIAGVHQIVGAVEPAPLVVVGQHRTGAVFFEPRDAPVAVFGNDQPSLAVERQPVRRDRPEPFAVALEDRIEERTGAVRLRPLVDCVGAHVREEESRLAAHPDRAFREDVSLGELFDGRADRYEPVEPRVDPQDAARACRVSHRSGVFRLVGRPATRHRPRHEHGPAVTPVSVLMSSSRVPPSPKDRTRARARQRF